MAGPPIASENQPLGQSADNTGQYTFALVCLTSLFFIWGFITALNDILIPYLKAQFDLSYTQAMLIQFCFFGAYFIVSLPAGLLVNRIGYQRGIVAGLVVAGIGCLLFYPAAAMGVYSVFLFALFVLASGITILQVSANPYVSVLGNPQTSSSRLTMTQAFNSLGTTIAPFFGALLILSSMGEPAQAGTEHAVDPAAVQLPYLMLATALFTLAGVFTWIQLPAVQHHHTSQVQDPAFADKTSAWQYKHLVLGAVGIFVYVGAEVGIGSFLVNFLGLPNIGGLSESQAAHYVAYYFGGAMIGRFIGALVMQKIAAGKVLAFNALCACAFVAVAIVSEGSLAIWAIVLVGLCNSIMFPTIFTLAIAKLGPYTSQGSGILCLAIVGGAVLPLLQGMLADQFDIQTGFILPLACYLFIAYYGVAGFKTDQQ